MNNASSIAFDDNGFFANTLECQDANYNSNGFFQVQLYGILISQYMLL